MSENEQLPSVMLLYVNRSEAIFPRHWQSFREIATVLMNGVACG